MKALIQRVSRASISIDGEMLSSIKYGYVVLLGVKTGDTEADALRLAQKTIALRIFPDEHQKMNLSIVDIGGEILVVSQFTLYANTHGGNRPSFTMAAPPQVAEKLYTAYVDNLARILGIERVKTGKFGAMMSVEIINDGPVTIELRTE